MADYQIFPTDENQFEAHWPLGDSQIFKVEISNKELILLNRILSEKIISHLSYIDFSPPMRRKEKSGNKL